MSAPTSHWLWEQHCCLPLHFTADITELARYPAGSYLSVNVGYSPQDKDQSSGLAIAFRQAALADGRFQAVTHLDDLAVARAEGRIALAFDLEDSRPLEGELSNVAHFYELGVRSLLPTYNHANAAGVRLPRRRRHRPDRIRPRPGARTEHGRDVRRRIALLGTHRTRHRRDHRQAHDLQPLELRRRCGHIRATSPTIRPAPAPRPAVSSA